jgi:hypothetical protein
MSDSNEKKAATPAAQAPRLAIKPGDLLLRVRKVVVEEPERRIFASAREAETAPPQAKATFEVDATHFAPDPNDPLTTIERRELLIACHEYLTRYLAQS